MLVVRWVSDADKGGEGVEVRMRMRAKEERRSRDVVRMGSRRVR